MKNNPSIKLTIPGTLPTQNEIIEAAKTHWSKYKKMKSEYTELVAWECMAQRLPLIEKQADFIITWYRPNRKHDKDNIMAGQKFIFDGIVAAGKMKNDVWKQIGDITHKFEVDKKNPRAEVEIREIS